MTPDEFTILETFLDVGDGYQLYVHDWGYKNANSPIIFLHGGPGRNAANRHKARFNPFEQRVIFFDQRGCGKSTPYGSLENNTTDKLVEDIEKIAIYLKLNKFSVTGNSWGACLALAYALNYPQRVNTMALQGVFTGSQAEIDYMDEGGFKTFFPDSWENYLSQTPESYRTHPTSYHYSRILGNNKAEATESAYIYENLEASLISLDDRFRPGELEDFDPTGIKIESHYMSNGCFMEDRYILNNAHKLTMPIWIVQGRYDVICPPKTAYELHQVTPNSTLIWTVAGHANDRSNYDVMRTILAHWN